MATTTTANGLADKKRSGLLATAQVRWLWIVLAILALLPLIGGKTGLISNYGFLQLSLMIVYAIAVLGLILLTGFNGQISLGHGAFYAMGAYCTAILMDQFGVPYWATLPIAGALVAPAVYLEPNMMASILLYGFAGALVGGISSPGGAVAGGFIVGVLENLIAYFGNLLERSSGVYLIGNGEKLSVALIIVITVLTLKPSGLFGHVTVKRV